jgi:hypothetical protein
MQPDMNEPTDARHDAASAAQARADNARERALATRQAAEQATTDYARRSNHRIADLHGELTVSPRTSREGFASAAAARRRDP